MPFIAYYFNTNEMYRCQLKNVNEPLLTIAKNFTICLALNLKFMTQSFLYSLCIFIFSPRFSVKTVNYLHIYSSEGTVLNIKLQSSRVKT